MDQEFIMKSMTSFNLINRKAVHTISSFYYKEIKAKKYDRLYMNDILMIETKESQANKRRNGQTK